MNEIYCAKGHWVIEAIDKRSGKIIQKVEKDNLIVDLGKEDIAIALAGGSNGKGIFGINPTIKIGKNGDSPDASDTGLKDEYRSQQATSKEWDDTNKRWIIWTTFTDFTETGHICEAGMTPYRYSFFNRVNFDPAIDFSPTINIKVTIYVNA